MFPRHQRLRSSESIQWVLAQGKRSRGRFLQVVYWWPNMVGGGRSEDGAGGASGGVPVGGARFTVIVGVKQLRKAKDRNRLKRCYRALARKHQGRWPAEAAVILMPRADGLKASFAELEKDYLGALPKG